MGTGAPDPGHRAVCCVGSGRRRLVDFGSLVAGFVGTLVGVSFVVWWCFPNLSVNVSSHQPASTG